MMIVTVSTLSDLLIISCLTDLSIWEKIVFNDQNLCLALFYAIRLLQVQDGLLLVLEFSSFALSVFSKARETSF